MAKAHLYEWTYKPSHIHLGLGVFWRGFGVHWGTCKAGPNSEHNGGHSQKTQDTTRGTRL